MPNAHTARVKASNDLNAQLNVLAKDMEFISDRLSQLDNQDDVTEIKSLKSALNSTLKAYYHVKHKRLPAGTRN